MLKRVITVALVSATITALMTVAGPAAYAAPSAPPGAPTGLTVINGSGSARVSWSAPSSDGGAPILRYTITPSVPTGCPIVVDGSARSAVVPGLPPGQSVTFTVTAANAAGFSSASSPSSAVVPSAGAEGYRLVGADGGVFAYGGAALGSAAGIADGEVVDADSTTSREGYWLTTDVGAVYSFGDASYFGGANALPLAAPVVGIAATAGARGYWLGASDGGVFSYGSAGFFGSAGAVRLNRPVVALAGTPSGRGYWLAASDGGIFAYGDAPYLGSAATFASSDIVDIAATSTGLGYWIVADDGAVYAFGDARYLGGANAVSLRSPITAIAATPGNSGYHLVAEDGGVFAFGDSGFAGSAANLALAEPVVAAISAPPANAPRTVQLIQLSDFHGQLDPLNNIGGAGVLSTLWKADRDLVSNGTVTVSSGDSIGAAPPLSSFFNEIPTIQSMNIMGFDVNGFGNHEFDKPLATVRNQIGTSTAPWVVANMTNVEANLPGLGIRPYRIVERNGVRIAFVGIETPETPQLVFPGNLGTMTITDPVTALNTAATQARAEGADIVVALAHIGVAGSVEGVATGPLVDLANGARGVDLVYGGHTHQNYQGIVNSTLVQQTVNASQRYTRTRVCFDPGGRRVLGASATSVTPNIAGVTVDPAITSLLAPYRTQLTAQLDTKIAVATDVFPRGVVTVLGRSANERRGEAAIGDLVADSLRAKYSTQLAITNGGGLRSALPSSYSPADRTLRRNNQAGYPQGPPYDIVLGDIQSVLPFGNLAVTRTVTGAQLWAALENGVGNVDASSDGRFPQISGFRFTWDFALQAGARVVSVELDNGNGTFTAIPNSAASTYTLATNDFMNFGGDGYTVFADGGGVTREPLLDVTADYVRGLTSITPVTTFTRITALNLPT